MSSKRTTNNWRQRMRMVSRLSLIAVLLSGSCLAAVPSGSEALLDNTSKRITAYLEQISDVRCTERVSQYKLGKNGKPQYTEEATFDYLVLMDGSNDQFLLNESRLQQAQRHKAPKNVSMLVSNGFSDLFLIFHPYYRNSFNFEGGQEEMLD